jgi:ubiquinone/menaquinone biosynthesis C-methylase UbiE
MSTHETEDNYWATYWATSPIIEDENPQCQVGRTVHKVPVDQAQWRFHLSEIERVLNLSHDDTMLDLCAGNGLITMPLSLKCKSVTAVDISNTLLDKIDVVSHPSITVVKADARKVSLPPNTFSRGLMYGALQYFDEREVIGIFQTIFQSLKQGGTFLIGDIPDVDCLFVFYCKPEWVKAYFDSIKSNTPAVGTWFKKEILLQLAKYTGFNRAEILSQHPDLINSHYRFDLMLYK